MPPPRPRARAGRTTTQEVPAVPCGTMLASPGGAESPVGPSGGRWAPAKTAERLARTAHCHDPAAPSGLEAPPCRAGGRLLMKQIAQNYRTGELTLVEAPV